jgi:hypothetical protein
MQENLTPQARRKEYVLFYDRKFQIVLPPPTYAESLSYNTYIGDKYRSKYVLGHLLDANGNTYDGPPYMEHRVFLQDTITEELLIFNNPDFGQDNQADLAAWKEISEWFLNIEMHVQVLPVDVKIQCGNSNAKTFQKKGRKMLIRAYNPLAQKGIIYPKSVFKIKFTTF